MRFFFHILVIIITQFSIRSLEIINDCPQKIDLGMLSTSCSTEVKDTELRQTYLIQASSEAEIIQYFITFGVQSISFSNIDTLQLFKYIPLGNRINMSFRQNDSQIVYYVSDQDQIYQLKAETFTFEVVHKLQHTFLSSFVLSSQLKYLVHLDFNSQLIKVELDDMDDHSKILIEKNVQSYQYNQILELVFYKKKDDKSNYIYSIQNKKSITSNIFDQSIKYFLVEDYIVIQQNDVGDKISIQILKGNEFKNILNEQIKIRALPKQFNSISTTLTNVKIIKKNNSSQWLYIFGNNLILLRMNCSTNKIETFSLDINIDEIDVRDSNIQKNNLQETKGIIDSLILDVDILDNQQTAFSTKNCIFVYDFSLSQYKMIKYQQRNYESQVVVANIIFISREHLMLQSEMSLQLINIIEKRIENDTRCLSRIKFIDEDINFLHYDPDIYRLYVFHNWGKLYQINYKTRKFEKLIIDLSQRSIIEINKKVSKIFVTRTVAADPIIVLDYLTGEQIQKIEVIWGQSIIEQIILNDKNNVLILISQIKDKPKNIYLYQCSNSCVFTKSIIPTTKIDTVIANQQMNFIILINKDQLISQTLNNIQQQNEIIVTLDGIKQKANKQNQNQETIISQLFDEVKENVILLTSTQTVYIVKASDFDFVYSFQIPLIVLNKEKIKLKRSNDMNVLFICDEIQILAFDETNGKRIAHITTYIDAKIQDFVFDDSTSNGITIIFVNGKGQLMHYIGEQILQPLLLHGKSPLRGIIIDKQNKNVITYAEDFQIVKYNYEKQFVMNQWVSKSKISQLQIDYKQNLIIHTSEYEIFFKDYSSSHLVSFQEYDDIFLGGFLDSQNKKFYAYSNIIYEFDYQTYSLLKQYSHNPDSLIKADIVGVDLIRSLDIFLSFSKDGSMSVWKYSTMKHLKNIAFDSQKCKFPVGGTYHGPTKRYYVRCEGGSIYKFFYKNYDNILGEWKVTQVIIVDEIDRIFLIGHNGQIFVKDPINDIQYLFKVAHKGWIYDLIYDSKKQQLISCGEDGTIQQWSYKSTTLQANKIYTHPISVNNLIYDQEIDIVLAFDKEGNILVLRFSSLVLLKKIVSITGKQIFTPQIDIQKNIIIGFSNKKILSFDYGSLSRDYYNNVFSQASSINSLVSDQNQNNVFILRNDNFLYQWQTSQLYFKYLAYLPEVNSVNSSIYYFEDIKVIVVITTKKAFLYDLNQNQISHSYNIKCNRSLQMFKYIICIEGGNILSILSVNEKFELDYKQKNISNNIITLDKSNSKLFVFCRSYENSLVIYDPQDDDVIQYQKNYHDYQIEFLLVEDSFIVTIDINGIMRIKHGINFKETYLNEQFKNIKIDQLKQYSSNVFFIKTSQKIYPIQVTFNAKNEINFQQGNSVSTSCFGSGSQFKRNNKNLISIICTNDLIQTFIVQTTQNEVQLQQVQLIRQFMLQDTNLQQFFFLSDYILALEYVDKQILHFYNENFQLQKYGENHADEQFDFQVIQKQNPQKDSDPYTLIYFDLVGIHKIQWPLLNQATLNKSWKYCTLQEEYKSSIDIALLFNSLSQSYKVFQNYLEIENFNITLSMKSNFRLNNPLQFLYNNISNLTIKGSDQIDLLGQPITQIYITKSFIDNCQQYNQFTFQNILLTQLNIDEIISFKNYNTLQLFNIGFGKLLGSYYVFDKIKFLNLKSLKIIDKNLKIKQYEYKVIFNSIDNLQLIDIQISKCQIDGLKQNSLFLIQESSNVVIQNVKVLNNQLSNIQLLSIISVQTIKMTDIQILGNTNLNQQGYKKVEVQQQILNIQHVGSCEIKAIKFKKNDDVSLIYYNNTLTYKDSDNNYITNKQGEDKLTIYDLQAIENNSYFNIISVTSQIFTLELSEFIKNIFQNDQSILIVNSQVDMIKNYFDSNKSNGNFMRILVCILQVSGSNFTHNHNKNSMIYAFNSQITQIASEFIDNSSEEDGSVYNIENYEESFFNATKNLFKSNRAKGSGGAINLIGQQSYLQDNTFIKNSASIGGAIRYLIYTPKFVLPYFIYHPRVDTLYSSPITLDSCQAIGNNICQENEGKIFGNNIGSYPVDAVIKFMNYEYYAHEADKVFENIRSGENNKTIAIQLLDEFRTLVKHPKSFDDISESVKKEISEYKAEFKVSDQFQPLQHQSIRLTGSTIKEYSVDGFNFSQIFILGRPNSSSPIFLEINSIYSYDQINQMYDRNYITGFEFKMSFRPCIPGEIINSACDGCKILECKQCQEGTYSLLEPEKMTDDNHQCKKCLPENTNNCSLSNINLKEGYWREDKYSDIIVECINFPQNCQGTPETGYCTEGLIGPLCEICDLRGDVWGKPYGKSYFNEYSCNVCKNVYDVVFQGLFTLVFMFYTTYTIIQVVNQSNMRIICICIRKIGILKIGRTGLIGQNTLYFKLLIHQLQLLLNLKSFKIQKIQIDSFFSYSETVTVPVLANLNSIDCFLYLFNKDIPHYVVKLTWSVLYLIAIFIFSMICYRIYVYLYKRKYNHVNYRPYWLKYSTTISLIFFIFIIQQGLVDTLIKILSCRLIGDKYYVQAQITEECHSDQHLSMIYYFVIPGLVIFVILWPVSLILNIYSHRDKLESSISTVKKLGFLYFGYKQKYFFWEFVKMYQRIIMVLVVNYNDQSDNILGLLVLFTSLSYSLLFSYIEPYREKEMNKIESFSSKIISMIFLFANIAKYSNTNAISLYIVILAIYGLISILVLILIFSIFSNLLATNSSSIMQIFLVKLFFTLLKNKIKHDGTIYNILKKYFPTLFKMIVNPQIICSLDKFKRWNLVRVNLKKYVVNSKQITSFEQITPSILEIQRRNKDKNGEETNCQYKESFSKEVKKLTQKTNYIENLIFGKDQLTKEQSIDINMEKTDEIDLNFENENSYRNKVIESMQGPTEKLKQLSMRKITSQAQLLSTQNIQEIKRNNRTNDKYINQDIQSENILSNDSLNTKYQ